MRRLVLGFLLISVFSFAGTASVLADSGEIRLAQQPPLPEGTVITTQNWQQYKDYMPLWMQIIFSGQYAYSLGPNQQVVVGPRTATPFPKEYATNTEKYSGQVGLKVLPDGGTVIQNYTAGLPFPHPTNPNVGDKLLWDLWYRYIPRVEMAQSANLMLVDKYHQIFRQVTMYDYMRLAHVNEPGLPIYTPEAQNIDLALYTEIISPEQSKYTAALVLYFTDPTRIQEIWSFVPESATSAAVIRVGALCASSGNRSRNRRPEVRL
jgi:hypothetical protein